MWGTRHRFYSQRTSNAELWWYPVIWISFWTYSQVAGDLRRRDTHVTSLKWKVGEAEEALAISFSYKRNKCNVRYFLIHLPDFESIFTDQAYHVIDKISRELAVLHELAQWSLGDLHAILKLQFSISFHWLVSSHRLRIMPRYECHGASPMISQHWFW